MNLPATSLMRQFDEAPYAPKGSGSLRHSLLLSVSSTSSRIYPQNPIPLLSPLHGVACPIVFSQELYPIRILCYYIRPLLLP